DKFESYDKRLGFLINCLEHLSHEIEKIGGKFYCFYGKPCEIMEKLIRKYEIECVFTSDSSSWTGERIQEDVKEICLKLGVKFISYEDKFLSDLSKIPLKSTFTSFYKEWKKFLLSFSKERILNVRTPAIEEPTLEDLQRSLKFQRNTYFPVEWFKERINSFDFCGYEFTRNNLDLDGSSKLSPYIRFGLLSLNKLYSIVSAKCGEDCHFIKELAWREYWYSIKLNFPSFLDVEFQEKYRGMKWQNNEEYIRAFFEARTGYPIVDAAIMQLKEENWIPNRARLILGSFLTKHLLTDWRIGEKFFMKYLIDYDEVVNVGNWQWVASVGPDPRPLRIFNPIIQAQKFDPEAKYIKKYLPELSKMPPYMLHDPITYKLPYHKPIVNHYQQVPIIKNFYLKAKYEKS
ncbi:MAG: cryptochrome/photolyase family protein, partial [bacterium]